MVGGLGLDVPGEKVGWLSAAAAAAAAEGSMGNQTRETLFDPG